MIALVDIHILVQQIVNKYLSLSLCFTSLAPTHACDYKRCVSIGMTSFIEEFINPSFFFFLARLINFFYDVPVVVGRSAVEHRLALIVLSFNPCE